MIFRQIIHANSLTYTSKEEHTLSGDIWGTDNNLEDVINLHRTGPYPDEKDFASASVTNGIFQASDLPYGAYDIEFKNSCDGKVTGTITFCDNYNSTITVSTDHLWKFKVVWRNADYGAGTITATDIKIDFDAQADLSGTKMYAIAPSTCWGSSFWMR